MRMDAPTIFKMIAVNQAKQINFIVGEKMLKIDMRKIYNFYPIEPAPDPAKLPTSGDLYYECLECTEIVNSLPFIKSACSCGNLVGSEGKLIVKNPESVRVIRGKLR